MSITGSEVGYSVWGPNIYKDNKFISSPETPDGSGAHPGSYSICSWYLPQAGD